jgi:hypothetical protein
MHQLSYTNYDMHSSGSYYNEIISQSTGTGQLIDHSVGNYQPIPVRSYPIAFSDYTQVPTLQVQPYYSVINSSSFGNLITTLDNRRSKKERLDKEIESDDFLKEFFSISKKIEHVPSPKQIKEQYYTR